MVAAPLPPNFRGAPEQKIKFGGELNLRGGGPMNIGGKGGHTPPLF